MRVRMKKLSLLALLLVLLISIPSAFAYFTALDNVKGSATLKLGETTTIEEPEVKDWIKHLVIKAEENSDPVFVRAIAYGPDKYPLSYSGDGWSLTATGNGESGYYYYQDPISGKAAYGLSAETAELLVKINNVPEEAEDFHVVVVYEATPAIYDSENKVWTCDWSVTISGE